MPTFTLKPTHYVTIPLGVSFRSYLSILSGSGLQYRVESELPVNVYVVDSQGLADYQRRVPFSRYVTAEAVVQHSHYLRLAPNTYHLLIVNPSYQPTAVHYEVS